VAVEAPTQSSEFHIVTHHDDPLVGPVVDKVVSVAAADAAIEVVQRDLWIVEHAQVRVLNATIPIPRLPGTELLDTKKLLEEPYLVEQPVAFPAPDESKPHVFQGYPVVASMSTNTGGVAVTKSGLVVAETVPHQESPDGPVDTFQFSVSTDGGHTFAPPVMITDKSGTQHGHFDWALTGEGKVAIAYLAWDFHDGVGTYAGLRYAVFDPLTLTVERDEPFPGKPFQPVGLDVATAPTGAWLAIGVGPTIQVWKIDAVGAPYLVGTIRHGAQYGVQPNIVGALDTNVVVIWAESRSFNNFTMKWARSVDGGTSFSSPREVSELVHGLVWADDLSLTADVVGNVHWALLANRSATWSPENPHVRDHANAAYLRFPVEAAEPTLRWISGEPGSISDAPGHPMMTPLVLVDGLRVWLFFTNLEAFPEGGGQSVAYAAESLDGGVSFGKPFRTVTVDGWTLLCPCGGDVFADGRPILSAYYWYATGDTFPSVMPYFDPLPPLTAKTVVAKVGRLVDTGDSNQTPVQVSDPNQQPVEEDWPEGDVNNLQDFVPIEDVLGPIDSASTTPAAQAKELSGQTRVFEAPGAALTLGLAACAMALALARTSRGNRET